MRKFSAKNGKVYVNNKPYYLKMLLDQGYWEDGILTPKNIGKLKKDIVLMKKMGFNGARKHQKIEDHYYYYYADKLGFIVWSENASSYVFDAESQKAQTNDWKRLVRRNYNYPCIMSWVPLNESWGVPNIVSDTAQQKHSLALVKLIKEYDQTRFVISNDGWEQTVGDLCCIHNYDHGAIGEEEKRKNYKKDLSTKKDLINSTPAKKPIYANGYKYNNVPIILSEFGGISYTDKQGWGYTTVKTPEELKSEYARLISNIKDSSGLAGFVYTQTTNVEQEINGLLTYQRKPKIKLKEIKAINDTIK
jgi:beta-galactosidase/beta-glucuronidase